MIDIADLDFAHPDGGFSLRIERFVVAEGEKLAVVGPSGSGKTTLLNLLAGILVPRRGQIAVAGHCVSTMSDADRRAFRVAHIGFIFQDFELLDYLSALDNILYPYRITDRLQLTADVRARAMRLGRSVGLADKLARKPAALSQGERQRIAICRALLPGPGLLLADEATGNLDPANKAMIMDLLFEQATAAGATLLAVTHDHELLPRFDRVVDFAEFRQAANA